jgi:hypothetical protein
MNAISVSAFLRSQIPNFPTDLVCSIPNATLARDAETPESASGAPPTVSQHSTLSSQPSPIRRRWKRHARRFGRPTLLTEEIADAMYEAILQGGVTDSRAGLLAKVSRSTVSRWKQEDPAFAEFLEVARTRFEFAQIKKVRDTPALNAQQEMRNAKWILQYANPERWGRRPRKLPASATPSRRAGAAPRSALLHPCQQSKSTPNCPESHAVSAAEKPELKPPLACHQIATLAAPESLNSQRSEAAASGITGAGRTGRATSQLASE